MLIFLGIWPSLLLWSRRLVKQGIGLGIGLSMVEANSTVKLGYVLWWLKKHAKGWQSRIDRQFAMKWEEHDLRRRAILLSNLHPNTISLGNQAIE